MMSFPQSLNPYPPPVNQLTAMLPPRGNTITAVDLAENFSPNWVALGRSAWERTILTRIVLDGQDCAVLPVRDGEYTLYSLPQATPEQLTRRRRLELTWANQAKGGTHFAYQLLSDRPSSSPVSVAAPVAPVAPGIAPHPLAPPVAPMLRPAMAPMSPPAIPLQPVPVPSVSAPVVMAGTAPAVPMPRVAAAPIVGAVPGAPQAMPHPVAAAMRAVQPVAETATENERHVAGVFGVTVADIRHIARELGAPARFTGDAVLECYVENFGSAGLEMVPKQWIMQAREQAQVTGVNGQQLLASTVLHSLIARMVEDREFAELRKAGAGAAPMGSSEFVVRSEVSPPPPTLTDGGAPELDEEGRLLAALAPEADEKPPETARNGAAAAPAPKRATGGQIQAMAKHLNVDPGWLLQIIKVVTDARTVSPDLVVELATAATLRLLVDRLREAATTEIDERLAKAEQAKAIEPPAEGEAPEAPDPEAEAANRAALIDQGIATRAIDWLAQQAQVGAL